ncbi:MAG: hypothetical protein WC866_02445 [Patescibacteria group bacterium]|jgi:hypothetical protein
MPSRTARSEAFKIFGVGNDQAVSGIVFLCRDHGGWNTLLPVIEILLQGKEVSLFVVASGWTLGLIEKSPMPFGEARALREMKVPFDSLKPKVFVTAGSWSDYHLEITARTTHPGTSMLYVENNYQMYSGLFAHMVRSRVRLPEFVCCIDGQSLVNLEAAYPQFGHESRAMTTGHPDFARFVAEDASVRIEARSCLALGDRRLVTYVGTPDNKRFVIAFAQALRELQGVDTVNFTVRPHPRDKTRGATYAKIFRHYQLPYIETESQDVNTVVAASDLVLSTWSTEIIHAALRCIPAVYVVDRRYVNPDAGVRFPLPPVHAGAALHCNTVQAAAEFVQKFAGQSIGQPVDPQFAIMRKSQQRFCLKHPPRAATNIAEHVRRLAR